MSAIIPDSLPLGENVIGLHVSDESNQPVKGAFVCFWKGDEVFVGGFTDKNGDCLLPVNVLTPGRAKITYTSRGFIPVEDSIVYYNAAVALGYYGHLIDDDASGQPASHDQQESKIEVLSAFMA